MKESCRTKEVLVLLHKVASFTPHPLAGAAIATWGNNLSGLAAFIWKSRHVILSKVHGLGFVELCRRDLLDEMFYV